MSPEFAVELLRSALYLTIILVVAIILPGLLVGLVVAVFQAATSVNEQTLSFLRLSQTQADGPEDVPFVVLVPAFVTSELKTAFQIGFMLFIPFLIIDLVVASILMAMGMMMLSPLVISLPFKLMLFVLVDGWALVVGTLAASFKVV